ncbi:hypothetical protein XM38_004640 [Halomicronema hongdechloris C2206]|uniref:Uncharacterized protein n=1 Tax=Halomicronema hongdechloris C2206 TaxID=1641165 RepID=A0A1Z3HH55_9CYAN|nr:hypothetical protein [Halomicronema hongdechloris]ASC69537.1 hypothetical protein XM38_004640 [Halomicronema hongdechloris C2206]
MAETPSSQSFSISNSQVSQRAAIAGQVGGDVIQSLNDQSGEVAPSAEQVVELITQMQQLIQTAALPDEQKQKALRHLDATKDEVQAQEPDKGFAVKNFQRATKVLQEAGATVEASQSLWQQLQGLTSTLAPWFGVAANTLLLL